MTFWEPGQKSAIEVELTKNTTHMAMSSGAEAKRPRLQHCITSSTESCR